MMQAPTESQSQAPLMQQLAGLGLLGSTAPASSNLAELVGGQIDLFDSIALASTLASLDRPKTLGDASFESPQRQFLNARGGMIRLIANCFEPGDAPAPHTLPAPDAEFLKNPVEGAKPFIRFYSLLQSEMDHRIGRLRQSLRASLGLEDQPLPKLAVLDRILDDTLSDYSRRVLVVLPKLLGDHFKASCANFIESQDNAEQHSEAASWLKPGAWLHSFNQDMQQLLLTELDFRLLPARALLDALDTQNPS
ncbi:MAG: hypothetical protein ACI89D_000058 [Bermanella sp.]|jgi:hypothetical protein